MIISSYFSPSSNPIENGELQLIEHIAPKCDTFIDVGANTGDWTELFLRHAPGSCSGLLLEPGLEAYKLLTASFEQRPGLSIQNVALRDSKGDAVFFEQPNAGTQSSLYQELVGENSTSRVVHTTTLKNVLLRCEWETADFVKVDTEGNDLKVLYGARDLLAESRLKMVQFEYNRHWAYADSTLGGAFKLLNNFEYDTFAITPGGLEAYEYDFYFEHFNYSNFLAVHRHHKDYISHLIVSNL